MGRRKTLTDAVYALADAHNAIMAFARDIDQSYAAWPTGLIQTLHNMQNTLIEKNKEYEDSLVPDEPPDIDEAQEWEDYDYACEVMEPLWGSDDE